MATVQRPDVLAAAFSAATQVLKRGALPTTIIPAGHSVFRAVDAKCLPRPISGESVSKRIAAEALKPRDGSSERGNRFSGPSYNEPHVLSCGGLYCSLQQQALVNEVMYYARRGGIGNPASMGLTLPDVALSQKCVLKIVLMDRFLLADLSPHNPGNSEFVQTMQSQLGSILRQTQYNPDLTFSQRMADSDDCSVARGVSLAVAATGVYRGVIVQTVRRSGRSPEERGDNLVLFGRSMGEIPGLYAEEALYFDQPDGRLAIYPVQGWR